MTTERVGTEAVDIDRLRAALTTIPPWGVPSSYTDTGCHHGYHSLKLVSAGRVHPAGEPFRFIFDRFTPVFSAFLSRLDPGGFIAPHRDVGPYMQRWQVPIHAAGLFDDDRPTDGVPFRVQHWQPHAVWNDTDQPRIHLVIDRHIVVDVPSQPYERFPVPEKYRHLVDAAR